MRKEDLDMIVISPNRKIDELGLCVEASVQFSVIGNQVILAYLETEKDRKSENSIHRKLGANPKYIVQRISKLLVRKGVNTLIVDSELDRESIHAFVTKRFRSDEELKCHFYKGKRLGEAVLNDLIHITGHLNPEVALNRERIRRNLKRAAEVYDNSVELFKKFAPRKVLIYNSQRSEWIAVKEAALESQVEIVIIEPSKTDKSKWLINYQVEKKGIAEDTNTIVKGYKIYNISGQGKIANLYLDEWPNKYWGFVAYKIAARLNKWRLNKVNKNLIATTIQTQKRIVESNTGKNSINVLFFMLTSSTWKLDSIYRVFNSSERFNATVVICPFIHKKHEINYNELEICEELCKREGYNYRMSFNKEEKTWLDVRNELKPNIVFFTNPNNITLPEYLIDNFLDVLTCYMPYSIRIDNLNEYSYGSMFSSLVWKNFYETEMHLNSAKRFSKVKGRNIIISGHPIIDSYRKSRSLRKDIWKEQKIEKKKIVWAPHWTIKGFQNSKLDWASFLKFSDLMLELTKKYESLIQVSFKPHPMLKGVLESPELWGKEKTSLYFKEWASGSNTQLDLGDYVELFITSNALIHDCGSFMVEYLELNKPVMYAIDSPNFRDTLNDLGKVAVECHYQAEEPKTFESFIKEVVIEGKDVLKKKRKQFRDQYLNPNGKSSADMVYCDIVEELTNG